MQPQDCSTWDAGYGGCQTYAPGGSNDGSCYVDADKYGILAYEACPLSCSGGQDLICFNNPATKRDFTAAGITPQDEYELIAARLEIPARALMAGTVIRFFCVRMSKIPAHVHVRSLFPII